MRRIEWFTREVNTKGKIVFKDFHCTKKDEKLSLQTLQSASWSFSFILGGFKKNFLYFGIVFVSILWLFPLNLSGWTDNQPWLITIVLPVI